MSVSFALPTVWQSLTALVGVFLVHQCGLVLYNLFFHPLSHFPGRKSWAATRLPYVYSLFSGNYAHDLRSLHDEYGKFVRTGPDELSIIDARAWKDIYGYSTKGKPEFDYNPIWTPRAINGAWPIIFAPKHDHTRMKRVLSPAFSMQATREQEPIIQTYANQLMKILRHKAQHKPAIVDINSYLLWTTFDMIGDLEYGEPFGSLQNDKCHPWIDFVMRNMKFQIYTAGMKYFPLISSVLLFFVPRQFVKAAKNHFDYSTEKLYKRIERKTDRKDIMSYMLKENMEREMTRPEIEATGALIIVGAAETTSAALTATTNLLIRNPRTLRKLQDEVRSKFVAEDEMTFAAIDSMEYVNAVLKESMRFAPPVPMQVPFQAPPEGGFVAGQYIPPNTMVGVPQYPAYRFREHFTRADEFIPERWLDSSKVDDESLPSFANDSKEVWKPFMYGPRNCIGENIAWAEMRVLLAKLIWNFDFKSAGEPDSAEANFKWESQRTFATWERQPYLVQIQARK